MRPLCLFLCSFAILASEKPDSIRGTVLDPSARAVQGARVECGAVSVYTNPEGHFSLTGPPCQAIVSKTGFASARQPLTGANNKITLALAGATQSVVVTATRTQTTPEEAGVSATLVTREELAERDYPALSDLLRDIPGVQIANYGGRGALAQVFTRGAQRTGTLVLLDGVPLNDPGGEMNLAHLTSGAIDRVEVVRSPESALFGAEASAAVVQLFTRRGDAESNRPHMTASYERGDFQTDRWLTGVTGGLCNRIDYSFSADQLHTAGEYPNSFYRDTTGTANLGYRISQSTQVRGIFNEYDTHVGTPNQTAFGIIDYAANEEARDSSATVQVDDTRGANFFQRFSFGYNRLRDRFNDDNMYGPYNVAALLSQTGGAVPRVSIVRLLDPNNLPTQIPAGDQIATNGVTLYPYDSINLTSRKTADYQGTLAHTTGALIFGYGYQRQDATVEGTKASRDNHGLFVQGQQRWTRRIFLSAGMRYQHSSAFGSEFTPRGAVSLLLFGEHGPLSSTFIRVSAGRGITEPSLYDNYVQSPYYHGNPALHPETTNTYEAGLVQEWLGRRVRTEVNVFRNTFQNLITFVTDSWVNVNSSWARGVETSIEARPSGMVRISGSYTRLYTRITNSSTPTDPFTGIGQELVRRPRNSGVVSLSLTPRKLTVVTGARFVGERQDADFTFFANRNPGYQNVYVSASYQATKHVAPVLRMDNLLNQHYQEVLGYAALTRNVMGGIRVNW